MTHRLNSIRNTFSLAFGSDDPRVRAASAVLAHDDAATMDAMADSLERSVLSEAKAKAKAKSSLIAQCAELAPREVLVYSAIASAINSNDSGIAALRGFRIGIAFETRLCSPNLEVVVPAGSHIGVAGGLAEHARVNGSPTRERIEAARLALASGDVTRVPLAGEGA